MDPWTDKEHKKMHTKTNLLVIIQKRKQVVWLFDDGIKRNKNVIRNQLNIHVSGSILADAERITEEKNN